MELAAGFFDSQVWKSWQEMAGVYLYPELPVLFSAKIPNEGSVSAGSRLVRGTLDLLADLPEGRLVVDFKTDQHLVPEEYKTQLGLYCQAAARLRLPGYPQRGQGSEPVKSALFSLRQGVALNMH
jgi:hypothetical protein